MRDRNLLGPFSSHVDSDKGGNKSSKGRIHGFGQNISALLRGVGQIFNVSLALEMILS